MEGPGAPVLAWRRVGPLGGGTDPGQRGAVTVVEAAFVG